jgi:O-antigen/teichoic acid export membrane protein
VPLAFVNILLVNMLFAARRQKLEMWASAATTATNVAANFLLIPRYGAVGAAAATVVCQLAALLTLTLMVGRATPFDVPWSRGVRVIGVALLSLAAVLLLQRHLHWAVLGPLAGGVFLFACVRFVYGGPHRVLLAMRGRT